MNRLAASVAFALCVLAAGACDKKSNADTAVAPPSTASVDPGLVPHLGGAGKDLRVTADEHGFTPPSLALAKGAPGSVAPVTFVRTTDKTCATEVVFPDLDIKKDLPLNQPVTVDVPTDSARKLTFQCGMAMFKGALVVH